MVRRLTSSVRLVCKKSVGIDFAADPPTFVEVHKTLGRIRSVTSGELENSAGDVALQPAILGPEQIPSEPPAAAVDHSAERLPFQTKADEVVIGLPRSCCVVRFLEVPDLEDSELNSLLAYEVDRHLPFPPEKALYSFQKLTRREGKAQVMMVAAKREEVERYLGRVEQFGLQPTAVNVSGIAALNAFLFDRRRNKRGVCSFVSLNGKEAGVSLVNDRVLVSSRSVFLTNGSFEPVIMELNRIRAICPQAPGKVFVCGETGEFSTCLQQTLGIQPEVWSPARATAETSALGLALGGLAKLPISINLLPPERQKKKRERTVSALYALVCLVALLGGGLVINSVVQERRMANSLDQRLAKVRAESATVAALRRGTTQLEGKVRLLNGLLEKQERPLLILKELTQLFPPSVSLYDFLIQEDNVRISGSTSGSAAELIAVLERSLVFENASFTSPISSQGKDRQGFQIQASIKSRYAKTDPGAKTRGAKDRR